MWLVLGSTVQLVEAYCAVQYSLSVENPLVYCQLVSLYLIKEGKTLASRRTVSYYYQVPLG
jgi:hypothetical protein